MNVVDEMANISYCGRKKVGAILVKDGRIIASGYNGTPAGFDNSCEDCDGNTLDTVIHAEMNALLTCAKNGISCDGAILFCTMAPCHNCAIAIIQAGVSIVVYKDSYRCPNGIDILRRGNIEVYSVEDLEFAEKQNKQFSQGVDDVAG